MNTLKKFSVTVPTGTLGRDAAKAVNKPSEVVINPNAAKCVNSSNSTIKKG